LPHVPASGKCERRSKLLGEKKGKEVLPFEERQTNPRGRLQPGCPLPHAWASEKRRNPPRPILIIGGKKKKNSDALELCDRARKNHFRATRSAGSSEGEEEGRENARCGPEHHLKDEKKKVLRPFFRWDVRGGKKKGTDACRDWFRVFSKQTKGSAQRRPCPSGNHVEKKRKEPRKMERKLERGAQPNPALSWTKGSRLAQKFWSLPT